MSRSVAGLLVLLAATPMPAQTNHWTGTRLLATDLRQRDQYGAAVAVSDKVIAVGAYSANGGKVYLFRRAGTTKAWTQVGAPLEAGGPGARFGFDLALDPKGRRLLVGAPGDGCGKVFLFNLESDPPRGRELRGDLPCLPGDEFGSAVALSDQAMAVGMRGADRRAGRVYASLDGGNTFQRLGFDQLAPRSELGQSLALSGLRLVAGAPSPYDEAGPGAAYVVELGESLTAAKLPSPNFPPGAEVAFGYAVAVSDDEIAVSAPLFADSAGAVFRFARDPVSGEWSRPDAPLEFATRPGDQLGVAVALDGEFLVVGARYAGTGRAGAAYLYGHGALDNPASSGAQFGFAAAIHGQTAVVGAFQQDDGTGAAYVFEDPRLPTVRLSPVTSVPEGNAVQVTVAAGGDGVPLVTEISVSVVVEAGTAGSEDLVLAEADGWQVVEAARRWSRSVDLGPKQTSASFEIPTVADPDCEANETFEVSLANPVGALLAKPSLQTVTILDDDAGAIILSPNPLIVKEGGPAAELAVRLSCRPRGQITVSLSAAPGVVTLDQALLTFTPSNWKTLQTVKVSGPPDDALCLGTSTSFAITASATGAPPGYRGAMVSGSTVDDDHTCVTGMMTVCVYADDTVIYTVKLSNTGAEEQEDLISYEFQDPLPSEVTVVTASATSGVATVDYAGNDVAWNGRIPLGTDVVAITIVAVLDAVPPAIVSNDEARLAFNRDDRTPIERPFLAPIVFTAGAVGCPLSPLPPG